MVQHADPSSPRSSSSPRPDSTSRSSFSSVRARTPSVHRAVPIDALRRRLRRIRPPMASIAFLPRQLSVPAAATSNPARRPVCESSPSTTCGIRSATSRSTARQLFRCRRGWARGPRREVAPTRPGCSPTPSRSRSASGLQANGVPAATDGFRPLTTARAEAPAQPRLSRNEGGLIVGYGDAHARLQAFLRGVQRPGRTLRPALPS
jgi:hypothetical protein